MKYPALFSEGTIGKLKLKNRVVMPSMGTMLAAADGEVTDHQIAYFEERARGGVGLIITEVTSVDYALGKAGPTHPRVDDNRYIPMLSRLANAVHKHGAKIFMQLHHAGRQGHSSLTGGAQIVAPSPIACSIMGETPRELTTAEVKELVQKFVMGALRCQMAGMDGVEIHGAHGYLVNQFLSPHTNRRTDEYGGSFDNRMRFAQEIVTGIKNLCGKDFPVIIRLSIDEFVPGGVKLEEGVEIACHMEEAGVDAINVSCGTYESMPTVMEPITYEQGWRSYIAAAVKARVKVPVITVGVIREPAAAEEILATGQADFVAIGRGLIADADWCEKASSGREAAIRKCISCLHCLDNGLLGVHLTCAVNARVGREREFQGYEQNGADRKVAIVGGGPAGMEAARVLALRQFRVVLFEKESSLGGQINFGNKPRGKEKMNWLVEYLRHELEELNVDLRLGDEASSAAVLAEEPYAVFVATGGVPILPPIAGINTPHVLTAEQALAGYGEISGERVAVIGAGMTGCETADLLASRGNEVCLVEMLNDIATGAGLTNKMDITEHLIESKVTIHTGHRLKEIGEQAIVVERLATGEQVTIPVDRVVISLGVRANNALYAEMAQRHPATFLLGDALAPRKIAYAIRDGFEKAFLLP